MPGAVAGSKRWCSLGLDPMRLPDSAPSAAQDSPWLSILTACCASCRRQNISFSGRVRASLQRHTVALHRLAYPAVHAAIWPAEDQESISTKDREIESIRLDAVSCKHRTHSGSLIGLVSIDHHCGRPWRKPPLPAQALRFRFTVVQGSLALSLFPPTLQPGSQLEYPAVWRRSTRSSCCSYR